MIMYANLKKTELKKCKSRDSRTVWFFIQVLTECLPTYHLQVQAQQARLLLGPSDLSSFWDFHHYFWLSLIWIPPNLGSNYPSWTISLISKGPGQKDLANTSTFCKYPSKSQKLPTSSTQIALLVGAFGGSWPNPKAIVLREQSQNLKEMIRSVQYNAESCEVELAAGSL